MGGEGGGPKSSNFRPHLSSEELTHRAFSESSLVVARNLEKGNEELKATGQDRQGSKCPVLPGSSLSEGRELGCGLWMGNLWREGAEAVQRRVKAGAQCSPD